MKRNELTLKLKNCISCIQPIILHYANFLLRDIKINLKICHVEEKVQELLPKGVQAWRWSIKGKCPAQFTSHCYGKLLVEYVFECHYLSYHYGQIQPYFVILGPRTLIIKYAYNGHNDDDDDDDDNNINYDKVDNNNDNNYNHYNNDTDNNNNTNNYNKNAQSSCQWLNKGMRIEKRIVWHIIDILGILMATMACQFCMKYLFKKATPLHFYTYSTQMQVWGDASSQMRPSLQCQKLLLVGNFVKSSHKFLKFNLSFIKWHSSHLFLNWLAYTFLLHIHVRYEYAIPFMLRK